LKFSIHKNPLLTELLMLQSAIERKTTIPILSNLLMEATAKGLRLEATDLDVHIATLCEITVEQPGAYCIPAKKLIEIVKVLPDAEVLIEVKADKVTIKCERSRFTMGTLGRENFPEMEAYEGPYRALPADAMRTLIDRTIFAITNEESRYTLNGAKLEVHSHLVRMVTTDGHRLALVDKSLTPDGEKFWEALVPKRTLESIKKLAAGEEAVEMALSEHHLFVRIGKRTLVSRLLTGQFPNYEMVVPKGLPNRMAINAQTLATAIRRTSLMADERSRAIKLELSKQHGTLIVTAPDTELGGATETLALAEYSGPNVTIAMAADYALDALSSIEGDAVMEFKHAGSQVLFTPGVEPAYICQNVVMPIRL
jgi:DNA polymerase-3 subunit beta